MTDTLAIALAQINPTVGDIDGNVGRILSARAEAAGQGAELVIAGELCVSGYPPEDLVLKRAFLKVIETAVDKLAGVTADGGPGLLIGAPWRDGGRSRGLDRGNDDERLYNATLLLDGGDITAIRFKHELPNYGVFDEKRIFTPGPLPGPVAFRGVRLGVMICEDMWTPDVAECLVESGAEILVVINGSPFETDKPDDRLSPAVARVTETGLPLAYVNLIGGQDELVFDGASFVLGADKKYKAKAAAWKEDLLTTFWKRDRDAWTCDETPIPPGIAEEEAIYQAMVLGLRDYVGKNGFPGVLIGLSGGIDSALSAAVAVDALGPERVHLVAMPSPFTSDESIEDAEEISRLLGCRLDSIAINPAMDAFDDMLAEIFTGHTPDTTEENIQARARGMTLMALSNKFGYMVLSTGNKSEMSVGYATLYGDMCGGYSVLKDVYKTMVFQLCRWRNASKDGAVMPDRVITKPPSAELKPDQTDQDTLPPYDELDAILTCLIEHEMSLDDIAAKGHDIETAEKVWHMLDQAEYKRRQGPPGVKITRRAFGRDRRYPLTNRFTGKV
ncbi:MAG: NAD+ synthase [Rhodospirillales bacterium]